MLPKGLGGYNQGFLHFNGGTNRAWLNLLIQPRSNLTTEQIGGMRYAMRIMHDTNKLNLPYRRYIFEGGLGRDVNGDGVIADIPDDPATPIDETVIETTVPWCFAFGEQEWVSGQIWQNVKQNASLTDAFGNPQTPVGRIACP